MIGTAIQICEYVKDKAGIFEVKQKTEKTLRSDAQRKYYFGVIIDTISNFTGYSPIETHELLKLTFKLKTTTGLSVKEFKYMVDVIRDLFNVKYNLHIPLPCELEDFNSLTDSLGFGQQKKTTSPN